MAKKQFEISDVQVLKSAAGYYIGRTYRDEEETDGMWFPYDRLSDYFRTKEEAEKHLRFYKSVE